MPRVEIRREETTREEIRREETTREEIRRRDVESKIALSIAAREKERDEKCRSGSQFDFALTKTLLPFPCRHVSPKDKKKYVS
ncbi:hypothetical protein Bca4012_009737 [Brassica carinata]